MVREGRVVVEVRRAVGRLALGGSWLAGWLGLETGDWRERREMGEALRVGCSVYGSTRSQG